MTTKAERWCLGVITWQSKAYMIYFGSGTFSTERPKNLQKVFQPRLLDVDGRFACDLDYLIVAQYIVQAKQVFNFIWRQKPTRHLIASEAKQKTRWFLGSVCAMTKPPTILPVYILLLASNDLSARNTNMVFHFVSC